MKSYRIEWTDRVDYSVVIVAESEEEALEKHAEEEYDRNLVSMDHQEYFQEPFIESEVELE